MDSKPKQQAWNPDPHQLRLEHSQTCWTEETPKTHWRGFDHLPRQKEALLAERPSQWPGVRLHVKVWWALMGFIAKPNGLTICDEILVAQGCK